jgi:magnesium transporter
MTHDSNTSATAEPEPMALRDADGQLSAPWLDALVTRLDLKDSTAADLVALLHAADLGDVLNALDAEHRAVLVEMLGDRFNYSALTEVDDQVRAEIIAALPQAELARGIAGLESDDAVFILEDIEPEAREAILAQMPVFERLSLRRSLDFPEDSAGRLMQTDFIAIPPYWSVGQTIAYLRGEEELPNEFYQIYVVDPGYKLRGTLPLDRLLRSRGQNLISTIMSRDILEVDAGEDQEAAARLFERYDLIEVAVVDEARRLVGVLTVDDIVDVIHEEAGEDIRRLAGVGDEEISDNVLAALKSRLTWLFVNMFSAILAASVIRLFDGVIAKMVAVAVLMPIVASMGGNAGTQTMTITVRALAMQELDRHRMRWLITREALVGLTNGVVFAVIMGLIAAAWFGNWGLGAVIGMALIVNLSAAGLAGILIPLGLMRLKVDPAVASGAFVTTVTDVVGFFSFLAFAGLWFHLF